MNDGASRCALYDIKAICTCVCSRRSGYGIRDIMVPLNSCNKTKIMNARSFVPFATL